MEDRRVRVRFAFAYPGNPSNASTEYPGTFVRTVDLPFDRTPALGEAVSFGGRFVTKVVQVLWRLDGEIEINLKVHSGLKARPPSRAQLVADGWSEM